MENENMNAPNAAEAGGTSASRAHEARRGDGGHGLSRSPRIIFCYILPVLFTAAIVALSIWGSRGQALAEEYKTASESMYRQAYTELSDSVYNIQIMLSKLLVSEAPSTLALTLDDIWRESGICAGLMGQIPQSHIDSFELNGFLVRLGDYARSLSKNVLHGKPISDDDRKQLTELYGASMEVYSELRSALDSGEIPLSPITSEQFFASADGGSDEAASDDADSRYPTLIYDGPFSESTEKQEARGLTGDDVDQAEALECALRAIGDDSAELKPATVSEGRIASYDFEGVLSDGRHIDISITVRGGHLLWMMSETTSDISGVPEKQERDALTAAGLEWLKAQGFGEMRPTYGQYYNGAALISYAAVQDGVLLYSDLVKVWIDRADGKVAGADCRSYLFSHTERELPQERMSEAELRGLLSPNLNVLDVNLALIPVTSLTETLCFEFKGTFGEDEYVVYLDAVTGDEVQIFRIISDENGQLAM